jgi:hypothetical protein
MESNPMLGWRGAGGGTSGGDLVISLLQDDVGIVPEDSSETALDE